MYTVPNIETMLTSLHQLHILCSAFLIRVFPFEFSSYHGKNVFWIKNDFPCDSFDYHKIRKFKFFGMFFVIYKWYQKINYIVKRSIHCFKMTGKVWKKIGYILFQGILKDTQCTLGRIWIKADHSWVQS